jgi:hypothetical protein
MAMTAPVRSIPTGLNEIQISRLFKCAVKDDDALIDGIVERLYRTIKDDRTVGLIVDRDATAGPMLMALLDEVLPDRRMQAAA